MFKLSSHSVANARRRASILELKDLSFGLKNESTRNEMN
jgi:hypothetical protein